MQELKIGLGRAPEGMIAVVSDNALAAAASEAAVHVLKTAGVLVTSQGGSVCTQRGYCSFSVGFESPEENRAAAVIGDFAAVCETELLEKYNHVVLPYNIERKKNLPGSAQANVVEYSTDDDSADLVAKNITDTDAHTSFELVGTGIIGRIKLWKSSGLTVPAALALSGALLCAGIPLSDVTQGLNSYSADGA